MIMASSGKTCGHFTVLRSATLPMNPSEGGGDLALIKTSLPFLVKCKIVSIKIPWSRQQTQWGLYQNKAISPPASLPFKGHVTEQNCVTSLFRTKLIQCLTGILTWQRCANHVIPISSWQRKETKLKVLFATWRKRVVCLRLQNCCRGQRLRDNWSNKPRDNQSDNSRNENYNLTVDVETLAGIITSHWTTNCKCSCQCTAVKVRST